MKWLQQWWKKHSIEELEAEEQLVIEKEHTGWLNRLTPQERQLYEFVIHSLETEPKKWEHVNWSNRALCSKDYDLIISFRHIRKMDFKMGFSILLEIPTTYHHRLIEKTYNKYLRMAEFDANTKRIEAISYELDRIKGNRKL